MRTLTGSSWFIDSLPYFHSLQNSDVHLNFHTDRRMSIEMPTTSYVHANRSLSSVAVRQIQRTSYDLSQFNCMEEQEVGCS